MPTNAGRGEVIVSLLVNDADQITGISSYTFSLLRALEAVCDSPLRLITTWSAAAVAAEKLRRTQVVHVRAGRSGMLTPIGYTLAANRHLDRGGDAVLLSTNPMGHFVSPIPQITVFHDLYRRIPGRYARHQRLFFEGYARAVIRASQAVVAVSHVTARDLTAWRPSVARKLHVIGEGSQFARSPSYDADRLSLLFVANIEANKNVGCLLDALRSIEAHGDRIEVRWVGRDRSGELARWLAANGPLASLTPLGVLDRSALEQEYRRAGALVVPSTAEGFCLPVVEAQGFGVPTILADIPILREVGGDGALFFDPRDPDSLAAAIRRFGASRHVRARLSDASSANAARYSWDLAATQMVALADTLRRRAAR